MLQRVGLCQTLLHDPELIVLDEPMSGLDPVGRALVRDLIIEQREAGKTVFFSSHILADVEAICDRVAILVGGQLRECGPIADVVADRDSLEQVLVGEMSKVTDESSLGVL
jgi:ABC-2 type transport system ATP-binding protein